ncbi:Holliday junction resolvase RuvX [Nocardioidaceae bacterium]|nr:Holliday junction resolvase RuvX [Nocardioidaceae bacterium]
MRRGVRLGLDPGDARIGVARCDPSGMIATPVGTVAVTGRKPVDVLTEVADLVVEHEAVEVVVGLPRSLSGSEGPAAAKARTFAVDVAARISPVPVRLCDERLSTVSAESVLREQGRKGKKRRAVVDQVAAQVILQHALDTERGSGRAPGQVVDVPSNP